MRVAMIAVFVISIAGCAELSAVKSGIAQHGAAAADEALAVARWQACQAATIGSLERDLGGDQDRIAGLVLWCDKKPRNVPLIPSPPNGVALKPL